MPVDPNDPKSNYLKFGKICSPDKAGAVRTNWTINGEVLFAKRIEDGGYSLTNMMYGKDGRIYLMHDGKIYTRRLKKV